MLFLIDRGEDLAPYRPSCGLTEAAEGSWMLPERRGDCYSGGEAMMVMITADTMNQHIFHVA